MIRPKRRRISWEMMVMMLVLLAFPPMASAYHFFYLDVGGGTMQPVTWQNLPVSFVVGGNGATDITPEIADAAKAWNDIATAKNVFATPTKSATAFTAANMGTAWGKLTGDGQQEVIFDEDGTIFTALGLAPANVNGYGPTLREVVGGKAVIRDAYLLLNGTRADFDRRSTEVHEFGHNQGIAHSSVGMFNSRYESPQMGNYASPSGALDPIDIGSVPTMHPYSEGTGQTRRTPKADDIAALSELYPEASFATTYGGISGTVTRCSTDATKPVEAVLGVNVRAVSETDSNLQLTRYSGYDGNKEGRFVINGLPAGSYKLIIEPMGANGFTVKNMAFNTTVDSGFPTEYYNPPDEDTCTDSIPDTAVSVAATAGTTLINKNFKVGGVDLAFVVDDTGSMSNEIESVKQVMTNYVSTIKTVTDALKISFPTTAIITFKDSVSTRLVSNDPVRLQATIDGIGASGGGDCPESSNSALLAAGRMLRKKGVAFFFTDADARPDGPKREAVESLFTSKGATMSALLTGACTEDTPAAAKATGKSLPSSENVYDEFADPPQLGNESGFKTFSEIAGTTGGFYTYMPGVKSGDATEVAKFVKLGTNIAVSSVTPSIGMVTPYDVPQGATLNIQITGSKTNFTSTSSVTFTGTGITVNSATVNSPTIITANITIDAAAATGFRDVTVTTNLGGGVTESAKGSGALNVTAPPTGAAVISVSPPEGTQGKTMTVDISGMNVTFASGATVSFGSGITVNSVTVPNANTIRANITIAATASIGARTVTITNGATTITKDNYFFVKSVSTLSAVSAFTPTELKRGRSATFTVTGSNTTFASGTSTVTFSGSGITVTGTTVKSATSMEVTATIARTAAPGFRDVTVTTGDESATLINALKVVAVTPDGDFAGDGIKIDDVVKSLRIATGLAKPSDDELDHGDIAPYTSGASVPDGVIDIDDAMITIRKMLNLL